MAHMSIPTRLNRTIRQVAQDRTARYLHRFRRDEDGAIVIFTLFALLMMLIAGGIAVDVMRHEMKRAQLQNTADSAVLAAAGAPATADAKAIVEDYFAKAGLSAYLHAIDDDDEGDDDIITTLNSSKVSISASMSMDTYLMRLSGVSTLQAKAASTAERRVPKLEVAMVLDVSGSMSSNNKMTNLKSAAKQFVTTILAGSKAGDAVISVVPFSWDVTPGPSIFGALNVDARHTYSTCLQFSDSDFDNAAIDPQTQQTQLIFTSPSYNGFDDLSTSSRTCETRDYAEILPFSIDATKLHNKIDSLVASGNTSGNMGMKWGGALLDPSFQSVKTALNALKDENDVKLVSDLVGEVPSRYLEAETLKVIIMMGDGQNTYSNAFKLDSSYRGPDSPLYKVTYEEMQFQYAYHIYKYNRSNSESRCKNKNWECVYESVTVSTYFLYDASKDKYRNVMTGDYISTSDFQNMNSDMPGFVSKERISWEMAWGMMSPSYLADKVSSYAPRNEFTGSGSVSGSTKDVQMNAICSAIKAKGVVIYAIGFEVGVNSTAERELKKCATSYAHYYRAQGININDAFSSIASNVVNLRLTQ